MSAEITLITRTGDPQSDRARQYLDDRGIEYTERDLVSDPSASAILLSRLGRVATPVFLVGETMLVGFDPVQLARFLPRSEADREAVTFGAAVRSVTTEIAQAAGLPATYGVEVGPVREEGPAAVAGIRQGDIITDIGSFTLYGGADQFQAAVAARQPGDAMALTIWRERTRSAVEIRFPLAEVAEA